MANMFWNLDKISETTAIHSGFRLCPIISHSSIRRTIPVAFIYDFASCGSIYCDRHSICWNRSDMQNFGWVCLAKEKIASEPLAPILSL